MDREQVAHQLRTPLTTIKGVLNLLAAGRLSQFPPEVAEDLLRRALKQLVELERVVERVEAEFTNPTDDDRVIVLYEEVVAA